MKQHFINYFYDGNVEEFKAHEPYIKGLVLVSIVSLVATLLINLAY